jgi:hypothetical protein
MGAREKRPAFCAASYIADLERRRSQLRRPLYDLAFSRARSRKGLSAYAYLPSKERLPMPGHDNQFRIAWPELSKLQSDPLSALNNLRSVSGRKAGHSKLDRFAAHGAKSTTMPEPSWNAPFDGDRYACIARMLDRHLLKHFPQPLHAYKSSLPPPC